MNSTAPNGIHFGSIDKAKSDTRRLLRPITPQQISSIPHRLISANLRKSILKPDVLRKTIESISGACSGDFWLVGGLVRDTLLECECRGDVDIMVENHDDRIHAHFKELDIPYDTNRHDVRQYNFDGILIHILTPQKFLTGFRSIGEVLRLFDLRINAIAMHWGNQTIYDPLEGLACTLKKEVGLNICRWELETVPLLERCILTMRLVNILENCPSLRISQSDSDLVHATLDDFAQDLDIWSQIQYRDRAIGHPRGSSLADYIQAASTLVSDRKIKKNTKEPVPTLA